MRSWSCLSKPAGFSGRGESRFYAQRLLQEMVGAESGSPDGADHRCPLLIAGESAQHPSAFSSPWFLIMPGSPILKFKCFSALAVLPVSYSCSWERMSVNSLGHECMLSLFLQFVMKWIIAFEKKQDCSWILGHLLNTSMDWILLKGLPGGFVCLASYVVYGLDIKAARNTVSQTK